MRRRLNGVLMLRVVGELIKLPRANFFSDDISNVREMRNVRNFINRQKIQILKKRSAWPTGIVVIFVRDEK